MKGVMFKFAAVLCLAVLVSGCGASSWVQLTAAGQQVRLALPAEVTRCTRIGTSNANVLDSFGFVQRGGQKLQDDLINLARNEAGDLGANRVVAESVISEGKQTFGVYRCP